MTYPTLTEVAKSEAKFIYYRDGSLWYRAYCVRESTIGLGAQPITFDFPIPVVDSGEGEFLPFMKGISLLRWARKHLEFLQAAAQSEEKL